MNRLRDRYEEELILWSFITGEHKERTVGESRGQIVELIIRVEEVGDDLNRFHSGNQNLDICSPDRPINMTGDPAREQDLVQNLAATLADE